MARLTSIDMGGHIDDVFQSHVGTRTSKSGGSYVDGIWQDGDTVVTTHEVTMQQLNQKDINFLQAGGQRIQDARKVYVSDGMVGSIAEADTWTFVDVNGFVVDGTFKCVSVDNRTARTMTKIYVVRLDV